MAQWENSLRYFFYSAKRLVCNAAFVHSASFCRVEQLSSLAYSAAAYHPPPTPYPVSGTMHHLPPLPRYPGSASRLPTPLLAATPPLDRVTSIG